MYVAANSYWPNIHIELKPPHIYLRWRISVYLTLSHHDFPWWIRWILKTTGDNSLWYRLNSFRYLRHLNKSKMRLTVLNNSKTRLTVLNNSKTRLTVLNNSKARLMVFDNTKMRLTVLSVTSGRKKVSAHFCPNFIFLFKDPRWIVLKICMSF